MKKPKIAPSLLSADFSKLGEELQAIERAGGDIAHLDVMDGHFVPNLTFGAPVIASIRKASKMIFDTHLMITDAEKYVEDFIQAGSNWITFHIEACKNPKALIQKLKGANVKAGVTLRPVTAVEVLEPYLKDIDLVLVMTVEPGFGGQSFMQDQVEKIRWLDQYRKEKGFNFLISVDGGINEETAKVCIQAGVDILVAGSYIFKQDYKTAIRKLRDANDSN